MMSQEIIVMDTETGGLDPKIHPICSITAKVIGKDDEVMTWFIKPYNKMYDSKALEVNGLTIVKLYEKGVTKKEFIADFKAFIARNYRYKPKILGHNITFDINFLKQFFEEEGEDFNKCFFGFKDTMLMADFIRDRDKIKIGNNLKLTELYRYSIGEDDLFKNAHTSEADVLMTEKLYEVLLKKVMI